MLSATGAGLRMATAALASLLVISVLGPAPAAAQAGGCDADGDGAANGVAQELLSDGHDAVAQDLEAQAGLVLGDPEAAHRWRVPVCTEAGGDGAPVRSVTGAPTQELYPEAPAWEAQALAQARDDLTPLLWRPGPRTSPHIEGVQVVGIEMWLAVDPDIWEPVTVSGSGGGGEVRVSATATPVATVWEFSDGVTRRCEGPGVQYSPAAGHFAEGTIARSLMGMIDDTVRPGGFRPNTTTDPARSSSTTSD